MEARAFGFRLPANAPEGQKRFPIGLSAVNFYDALVARIPLGRIVEPEDVRNAVLFFVSSGSDFITGQVLYLDGGITATQ